MEPGAESDPPNQNQSEREQSELSKQINDQLNLRIADDQQQLASHRRTWWSDKFTWSGNRLADSLCMTLEDKTSKDVRTLGTQVRTAKIGTEETEDDEKPPGRLHCNDNVPLWIQQQAQEFKLNPKQKEIYHLCCNYLQDPFTEKNHLPPTTLLSGAAGTGKSTVVQATIGVANQLGYKTVCTAFRTAPVFAIGRHAAHSMPGLQREIPFDQFREPSRLVWESWTRLFSQVAMLMVDQAPLQVPSYLAQLNCACQQGRNVLDRPFGGIPVLLVGDFNQLGPVVAGPSSVRAIMAIREHEKKKTRKGKPKLSVVWIAIITAAFLVGLITVSFIKQLF